MLLCCNDRELIKDKDRLQFDNLLAPAYKADLKEMYITFLRGPRYLNLPRARARVLSRERKVVIIERVHFQGYGSH